MELLSEQTRAEMAAFYYNRALTRRWLPISSLHVNGTYLPISEVQVCVRIYIRAFLFFM